MAPGVSDIGHLTLPLRTHGAAGGAVVIEAPIPLGRGKQAEKALRRVVQPVPGVGDRPAARPALSQGRGFGVETVLAEESSAGRGPAATGASASRSSPGSSLYAAQVLAQETEPEDDAAAGPLEPERLRGHDAYRRGGGEPALFPEEAAIFSFAV